MSKPTKTEERVSCQICGKTLTREQSVNDEIGHRCDALREQGWTPEALGKHYAKIVVADVPEGYVKLADFKPLIKRKSAKIAGLTVTKLVNAIGKDRAVEGPAHPIARPVYVGTRRVRYVDPWLASDAGLTAIATGDWSKAPAA